MEKHLPFNEWLADELKRHGWSMSELARRSSVSRSLINGVVMAELEPSWEFCAAIAAPLGRSTVEVLLLAGKLTASDVRRGLLALNEQEVSPGQQLSSLVKELDAEDQQALLRITRRLLAGSQSGGGNEG